MINPTYGDNAPQQMDPTRMLWAGILMDFGNILGPQRQAQGLGPQMMMAANQHNRQLAAQQSTDAYRQGQLALAEERLDLAADSGVNDTVQSVKEVVNPDGTINLVAIHRSGNVKPLTGQDGSILQAPMNFRYIEGPGGSVRAVPTQGIAGGAGGVDATSVLSADEALAEARKADLSKAETAAQIELPQQIAQAEAKIGNLDRVLGAIDETKSMVSGWTTGWGSLLQYLPETDARALSTQIARLNANTFLDGLAELKSMGGTVGQVTEAEGKKIEGKWAAVDQATDQPTLLKALNDLDAQYRSSAVTVQRALDAHREQAGVPTGAPVNAPTQRLRYNRETGRLE